MTFVLGLLAVSLILKIISVPIKIIIKIAINSIAGMIVLLIVNSVLSVFNFTVPITGWTSFLVGVFGIPMVVLLVLYHAL